MEYSVVGLPHYTIWHLYEPSVDDIKHMEASKPCTVYLDVYSNARQEMEQERVAHEQEEKEKAEKATKVKESFGDATKQWEKDKTDMQNMAHKDEKQGGKEQKEEKKDGQQKDEKQKTDSQKSGSDNDKLDKAQAVAKAQAAKAEAAKAEGAKTQDAKDDQTRESKKGVQA
jgi:mannan polymerase II complex ANP1 subunit